MLTTVCDVCHSIPASKVSIHIDNVKSKQYDDHILEVTGYQAMLESNQGGMGDPFAMGSSGLQDGFPAIRIQIDLCTTHIEAFGISTIIDRIKALKKIQK